MMFSVTMLPPLLLSILLDDGVSQVFLTAFACTFGIGLMLWLLFRHNRSEMRIKDGFLVTVMFYLALGSFGAIPFVDPGGIGLSMRSMTLLTFTLRES